jgi:hypothetical protein
MNRNKIIFLSSRVFGIVARPLMLYLAISMDNGQSEIFALLFTLSASVMQLVSFEPHLDYYKEYFSNQPRKRKILREYLHFIKICLGMVATLLVVSASFLWWYFDSFLISIAFSFFIVIDKILDEFQRFNLFDKKFTQWSFIVFIQYFLPVFISLLTFYYISGVELLTIYLSVSVCTGILLCIFIFKKLNINKFIDGMNLSKLIRFISLFFKVFINRFNFLIVSFTAGHVILSTRYIVMLLDDTIFPVYVMLLMVSNSIVVVVDVFYMSFVRSEYVKNQYRALKALKEVKFWLITASALCLAIIVNYLILTNDNKIDESILYISIMVPVFIFFYAFSIPFYENIYWHKNLCCRVFPDIAYYGLLFLGISIIIYFGYSLPLILALFILIMILRSFLHFLIIKDILIIKKCRLGGLV